MDGIHDLGGKPGYGAVDAAEPEIQFKAEYEGRMWALTRTARVAGIGIDWWRHCRELIDPDDYLQRSYFDSWAQTEMAAMLDAGAFTLEELLSGVAQTTADTPPVLGYQQVLDENASKAFDFSRPSKHEPQFSVGDLVQTATSGHAGHTRLPEYARGKRGVILKHHGCHIFPDDAAQGTERATHLYTVAFDAAELWETPENPKDQIMLELWENYLAAN